MLMGRLDIPTDQGYSPSRTNYADMPTVVPAQVVTHRAPAFVAPVESIGAAQVPKPPDPATGGAMGPQKPFGYSTGLSEPRRWRQRFSGRTLVVPTMGVHPAIGPVTGDQARSQKLSNGVIALAHDYTPVNSAVAGLFSTGFNPLLRDM